MYSYTIHTKGKNEGPFTLEQAKAGLADGTFAQGDLAWRPGLAAWAPLAQRLAEDTGEVPPLPGGAPALVHATPGKKPFNWLIPAILSTVFCCWPIGILAIVFAVKANSKQDSGDTTGAAKSRGLAQGFTIATLCLGLLIVPVGMMAALAIPAFKKVRNNAIEKTMMNDARQISSAANQVMAEEASAGADLGKIRAMAPHLSSGVTLVIDGRAIPYISGGADKIVLKQAGKFSLRHEQYSRRMATRSEIQMQPGPDNEIEFSVETGSPTDEKAHTGITRSNVVGSDAEFRFASDVKTKFADSFIPLFRKQGGDLTTDKVSGTVKILVSPSGRVSFSGWHQRPVNSLGESIIIKSIQKMPPVIPPPGGEEIIVRIPVSGFIEE